MKERILQIMEAEQLTPSLFADKLNIGRAVISHILNGRNNPSLDVTVRILETFGDISSDWLMMGKGNMHRVDNIASEQSVKLHNELHIPQSPDLFSNLSDDEEQYAKPVPSKEVIMQSQIAPETNDKQNISEVTSSNIPPQYQLPNIPISEKKVNKVIIYYSDNTFQAFNPDSSGF